MAHCPCPRCLVTLDQIHEIGTKRDMLRRVRFARQDNDIVQEKIARARRAILLRGAAVRGLYTEPILKPSSMTPNRVRSP